MNEELRAKNLEVVKKYFQLHGVDRLQLFHDEGKKTIPFNPSYLKSYSWSGREKLKENFIFNSQDLSEWEFKEVEIIPALDPDFFMVKTNGEGSHSKGNYYKNVYIFTFQLKDGLIMEVTEYMNPINGMVAEGYEIPEDQLWDSNKLPFSSLEVKDYSK